MLDINNCHPGQLIVNGHMPTVLASLAARERDYSWCSMEQATRLPCVTVRGQTSKDGLTRAWTVKVSVLGGWSFKELHTNK